MRVVPLPLPLPSPPIFPSLITNEFIRARVYAGSVRMENLHGGMGCNTANGAQIGRIRRLCRISASFLRSLFASPGSALSTNGTLRYTKRGGGEREGGEKRRNSLVGLSVSRASDFCFGTRYTRVPEYLMRLVWLLMRTLLCAVNTGGYPGARLMPMWH